MHLKQKNTEISEYAYERTLMMEQRGEIFERLNVNRKQSLLLEHEVDGRLVRFRIRKPSTCDFDDLGALHGHGVLPLVELHHAHSGEREHGPDSNSDEQPPASVSHESIPVGPQTAPGASSTQTAAGAATATEHAPASAAATSSLNLRPNEANVRRMQTALSLNEAILRRSKAAKLVIINLPSAPKECTSEAENNYMEFVEIITDKLERVLFVQNGGREVITIHS